MFCRRLKAQSKIWCDKHQPSKRRKATKRYAAEDSDHEVPGAKLSVVLPDSDEEDDSVWSPGNDNKSDE
jgi:hypothetical protein